MYLTMLKVECKATHSLENIRAYEGQFRVIRAGSTKALKK